MATTEEAIDIARAVEEVAYQIFCACNAKDDYCIQDIGCTTIVFGGTNRLIFNINKGWYPDKSYCRLEFLACWDAIKSHYSFNH